MKILIIGNSAHLHESINLAFPNHEIKVIPWRTDFQDMSKEYGDLIFLIGFDYCSYMKRYEEYMEVNIYRPLWAARNFSVPSSDKIFITTQNDLKSFTFSRYRYAKEKLGFSLFNELQNSYIVRFDTFTSINNEPLVKGGVISILLFKILIKLGLLKTSNIKIVTERLKNYKLASSNDIRDIKGYLISLPRPQLFDRLLRILLA